MHTFFVNTSGKELDDYSFMLDVPHENRELVCMQYSIHDWQDPTNGYVACVDKMSAMIDGYAELNNTFNLVLYIELTDIPAYTCIERDAFHDRERKACLRALHILYTHMLNQTLLQELETKGRTPQDVLLMFGEDKHFVNGEDCTQEATSAWLYRFLGLPEEAVISSIAPQGTERSEQGLASFREKLQQAMENNRSAKLRESYRNELQFWSDDLYYGGNRKGNESLSEAIMRIYKSETERSKIKSISCPYDCVASRSNKSAYVLGIVNVLLHLSKCVRAGSVYAPAAEGTAREPLPFYSYSAEELGKLLSQKAAQYDRKHQEIEELSSTFSKLGLVPELKSFDFEKFGLDIYGERATDLLITDRDEQQDEKKEEKQDGKQDKKQDNQPSETDTIPVTGKSKQVVKTESKKRVLLADEEYEQFQYDCNQNEQKLLGKKAKPEEYIRQAMEEKRHHSDFFKKLKMHFSNILTNYARKSEDNEQPILRTGGFRYAGAQISPGKVRTVREVAQTSYRTILHEYLKFNAGRSLAMTDIDEQCNWFVTRINQISESLKKILRIALGLLLSLLILYIPFAVIQWDGIVENPHTIFAALCSIVVPIVLLTVVLFFTYMAQRRKYRKAWLIFKQKADAALAENTAAAKAHDALLSTAIPALRWVYEYKLDVAYWVESCAVASAKVEHHKRKINARITAVRNLISDIEYREDARESAEPSEQSADIDYNRAFCSGEKNRAFYTVFEKLPENPTGGRA